MKPFVPKLFYRLVAVLLGLQIASLPQSAIAQVEAKTECGAIIEGEFGQNAEAYTFLLTMAPGESFKVSIEPTGDFLKTAIIAFGPSGILLGSTGGHVEQLPILTSGTLSARGIYKIKIANTYLDSAGEINKKSGYWGGVGVYTLAISCTLKDGTIIEPGDTILPTATPTPPPTLTPRAALPETLPTFIGTGFPGLAPVDFADAVTVPLLLDEKMAGVIPLDNQILGFTLDAAAGDTLDLSYTRVSGNMNLGLVVLSANNEVFFQASLVTSEALSTQFTLPEAGQYTIGVFRISLVEPAEVEPTVFQLAVTTVE